MKFWKKYKVKKKLEKARFINFYGKSIDLYYGKMLDRLRHAKINNASDLNHKDNQEYVLFKYNHFLEEFLFWGQNKSIQDDYYNSKRLFCPRNKKFSEELCNFIKSDKFTEYLNEYQKLKEKYELLEKI